MMDLTKRTRAGIFEAIDVQSGSTRRRALRIALASTALVIVPVSDALAREAERGDDRRNDNRRERRRENRRERRNGVRGRDDAPGSEGPVD